MTQKISIFFFLENEEKLILKSLELISFYYLKMKC